MFLLRCAVFHAGFNRRSRPGIEISNPNRKVTHGCIIATLKLYLPDGKEAKASPSIVNTTPGTAIPAQDLYQLNQFIQVGKQQQQHGGAVTVML